LANKKIKSEVSAYEQELVECGKKIKEYKLACEANIVAILWKKPDLYFDIELKLKDFSNNIWKVYWQMGHDIIVLEQKSILDEITVGLYLEKHNKLKEKYDEYGGYNTIFNAQEYVKVQNIDGYINELYKWNAVMNMLKMRFPIHNRLSDFVDMSLEEIYDEYEAKLNHIFVNAEGDEKTVDIADDIESLIDELDEGEAIGLPLFDSEILTKEIGGLSVGNITLIGGLSGTGKSTFVRNTHLKSIIDNNERILIMINEEGKKKWQREFLIWVANNIYKKDIQKYQLRDGKYSIEFKTFLKDKCAKWISEHKNIIKLLPFKSFNTNKAIKYIKKYSSLGCKYFVLDTYKADANTNSSEAAWFNMQQNMVKINDVIKPEEKNVHITVTFQLGKNSSKQRFYTQDNIGMAKNIVDVASTCIMIRKLFDDEYEGEKNQLQCFRIEGKSKIGFFPKKGKHYQILFITKNREGATNDYQIVIEHDLSRNTYKEVGITNIPMDF
jgi:replicative DNA helicase